MSPEKGSGPSAYSELLSEIIALHPSKYVHIGGDEAYLLGRCPQCKDYVHKHGKSALFVDHINMITELITEKGKVPVLWADIIMKYPEAIDRLPDQSVLVNWNYGWGLNHFGDHSNIVNSGFELWGALSLRSWPDNYFLISWRTHFKNLEDFIPLMREHGYEGVVMTSWSTSGLYTFLRETKYHVVEMYPIRHVYPLAGLKMSVDAYTEAINAKQFDAHEFVSSYARENFGLNPEDAETFWKGLNVPVETIEGHQTSRKRSLSELAAETRAFSDFLNRVKVNSNKKEFAYYRLLYDIRQYYIDGKLILVDSENMDYHPQSIQKQLTKLDALKSTGKKLDRRFKKMYKGSLYPALITEENYIRNREMEVLYHKLNRSK
ncbi:MAG: N-acetyl-beta-hexosaminidase [Bacteroidetes bacterium]|nr:MAG: N-acetyl-beta-hexosaminidase [Bacteroidota bacterium]